MITPARRKSLYEDISNQIIELISSGAWKESERIPGEIELAGMFKVSRNSVRESVKALEMIGILRAKSGNGTFVAEGAQARIRRFKAQDLPEDEDSLVEIMEARLVMEPGLVKLATQRLTEDYQKRLESSVEACRKAFQARNYDFELGFEFHQILFQMSGNKILINLFGQMKPVLVAVRRKIFFKHNDPKVLIHEQDQHAVILDLIRKGQGEAAAALMESHIAESLRRLRGEK
ncbi:MAG: FadR family transcriptional regulator [Treponema sp.]|nr:FadR family transcriptional regulator [Treponema sp.]